MSKIHILSGWFLALAMLLASCESDNMEPGKVNGGLPGQATRPVSNRMPGQGTGGVGIPDAQSITNNNPQTPIPPQVTLVPQTLQSHPDQPEPTDNVTDWQIYIDSSYHYQIAFPHQFKFRVLENPELVNYKPEPVGEIYFYDPSSSLGGIAPPNFSIRIYAIGAGSSVEGWLEKNGLYLPEDGWTIEEYHGEHFSGFRVNSSLYMAPGSFIYATRGDYLFQLTPLGQEAETMLTTFEFTQ